MAIYLAALTVAAGLALTCLLLLSGSGGTATVAHSLALIRSEAQPQELARNQQPASERLVKPFFDVGRRLARRLTPTGASERLARSLDVAGNPRDWRPDRLLAVKGVGLLLGAVLGLLLGHLSPAGIVEAVALGAFCFYLPDILVHNLGTRRQEDLRRGLAESLDMLTVCVQAGQSFDAALQQVAQTVEGSVAGEFARVLQEISIGRSRPEAFGSMAARTTVPEIKTFVTAIVQADRMGLSIGKVLHEQAEQMRLVRKQRAEELAQKVPIKLMFPMVACIFPMLFVVLVGPGVMRIIGTFSGAGF
ncbi:MAG: type II secretion system F family protein [Marmoricola sp.]